MPGELDAIKAKEEAGDEYVRTPELRVGGQVARATDVAVGSSYILVAAECDGGSDNAKPVLFAAGSNRHGSLGLGSIMDKREFVEEFVPVGIHSEMYARGREANATI